jgi:hypothetical protein
MSMPTRYRIAMSRARLVRSPGGPGMGGSLRLKERSMSMPTRYHIAIDRACFDECSVTMPTSTVQRHCALFCFLVPCTVNDEEEGPISETLLYWRSL